VRTRVVLTGSHSMADEVRDDLSRKPTDILSGRHRHADHGAPHGRRIEMDGLQHVAGLPFGIMPPDRATARGGALRVPRNSRPRRCGG
jgi:hypothetical protein